MRTNHYPQTYVFIVFYGRVLSIWRMMIIIMDLVMGMIIIWGEGQVMGTVCGVGGQMVGLKNETAIFTRTE